MAETTYPPLNVLKPVTEGIWIVDSGPFRVAGFIPVPVRMTVVRLSNGGIWLHSPIQWSQSLQRDVESLGPIGHLIVPNPFHWSFVREWQAHCPDAHVAATEGTKSRWIARIRGPTIDCEIGDAPHPNWSEDFDQVIVRGRFLFRETVFFHRASRTAILTDLVVNLDTDKVPVWERPVVSAMGSLGPRGKAPVYARMAYRMNGAQAARAAKRLIAMNPERVIFCHGQWYTHNGATQLAASLRWLTGPA
jgi:Domain of unknown function (DUF4336)